MLTVIRVGEPDPAAGVRRRRHWGCCIASLQSSVSTSTVARCRVGSNDPPRPAGPCSAPSQLTSRPWASNVLPLVRPLSARKTERPRPASCGTSGCR